MEQAEAAMSRTVALFLLVLSPLATCTAQKLHACKFSETDARHFEGIDIHRITVIEPSGRVQATVLVPNASEPMPGIVFSHSAIQGPNSHVDLLRFALGLARAGASSIILNGTIDWQSPSDESIRPPEFQFCAGLWLMQHVNLDLTRTADAGNHKVGWIDIDVAPCGLDFEGRAPCWPGGMWLNFGQIGEAESRNTDAMLTPQGRLWMARVAQKHLQLKEIQPEWFTEAE
jgi:hypothetical protein